MDKLKELYQKIILQHNRHPQNFGELTSPTVVAEDSNPICGDEMNITLLIDTSGIIQDIRFRARGCALNMASGSLMTELVKLKSVFEVKRLAGQIRAALLENENLDVFDELGDYGIFRHTIEYPVRVKCVLLAWDTLLKGIEQWATIQQNDGE